MPNPLTIPESTILELIAAARGATGQAYCPYSTFAVGAAVLTEAGSIFAACNVENASYGLTMCAERSAIFRMVAERGHQTVMAMVVYTPTNTAAAPCGACRQVLHEFGPEARVISICDSSDRIDAPLSQLLPSAFGPDNLR